MVNIAILGSEGYYLYLQRECLLWRQNCLNLSPFLFLSLCFSLPLCFHLIQDQLRTLRQERRYQGEGKLPIMYAQARLRIRPQVANAQHLGFISILKLYQMMVKNTDVKIFCYFSIMKVIFFAIVYFFYKSSLFVCTSIYRCFMDSLSLIQLCSRTKGSQTLQEKCNFRGI